MTEQMPGDRGPVLWPFLLGVFGAGVVLVVLLYRLVWRSEQDPATIWTFVAFTFIAAFFWSGFVLLVFPSAPHGVASAGYAAVWVVLGLLAFLPWLPREYMTFLFVSFLCLFVGRLGERVVKWVFPERFQ
mgnify:CR=1 FL=1